jgi:hypothetical protein
MKYSNAQYLSDTVAGDNHTIFVEIDGISSYVPIDQYNTDYASIMELVGSGDLVIAPANEN